MILFSFIFFLLAFVAIGLLSSLKKHKTSSDYLLAGQSVKPWLVALSAVATNNSGYMFIGMIGYTYTVGLSSIWLMIGWISGDFLASLFIHRRIRATSEKEKVLSFSGVLSSWHGTNYNTLRFIGGVLTVIFLGTYAAAQFSAGSKALHVLLGWDYSVGAIICAVVVMGYCFAGGIRASIWTNTAQSVVMFGAMILLFVVAINAAGGFHSAMTQLAAVSPTYLNLFPSSAIGGAGGPLLFVAGWIFAGFAVVGQPHIMTLFMSVDDPDNMKRVRAYYYSWYSLFFLLTIGVGLATRLLLPETGAFDAELALPTLAMALLPEILVGVVLAGLFAAAMSTADSQLLCCSAALTRDLTGGKTQSYLVTKLATLCVTLVALTIALMGSKSVFALVLIAWSALGSAFAPLLVVYALGGKPSERVAIAMVAAGVAAMLAWREAGLGGEVYEVMPGILAGFIPYLLARILPSEREATS